MSHRERAPRGALAALAAAIALALATRLSLALADPRALIAADVVQDDAFYYLVIARNLVRGLGFTFDGASQTNAFHPLYLALLAPLASASPAGDPLWLVRASTLALALLGAATTPLVFALARSLAGVGAAVFAAFLFAASPALAVLGVNGQETGLAFAAALALAHAHLRARLWRAGPFAARALAFGALAGVAVLARVDLALLCAVLGLDVLRRARSLAALAPAARALALATAAAFAIWLPWGIASAHATGAWLPTSGAASREIALHLGWSNLPAIFGAADGAVFDPTSPPLAWRADVGARGLLVALFEQPLLAPLRLHIPYGVWPALESYAPQQLLARSPRWVASIACVAALALAARWFRGARARAAAEAPDLRFVAGVYALASLAAYTLYSPSHWYWPRYLAPSIWLVALAALAPIARFANAPGARRPGLRRALAAVAACLLVAQQLASFGAFRARGVWRDPGARGFLSSWEALGPQVPPGAVLGAFQAGIYGWMRGLPVRNLDGKVDAGAQRALASRRVHDFVFEQGIEYVLDQPAIVRLLMLRHAPPAARERFVPVAREARRGGAILYRVEPAAGGAETRSRR